MKKVIICLIRFYRLIAPFIPGECRFYPTCSHYMQEAIEKKGIWRGIAAGSKRILRCNPLFPGGYDPVK
ncbi:MAG TPA: membrane protein insertion efficiency factor YidD [Syntrophorhabdaceae bacterium]|nr:membrane protein insertion efficiency factor YidD [Syntrophorhabdaceae bacterium]